MNTKGFIQLNREFLNWQWYDDGMAARVFLHLLLTANYAPVKWHGITVERGQRAVTMSSLAEETGLSKAHVYQLLKKLQKSGDIEQSANAKFTVVTVKNYDDYTSGQTISERGENVNHTQNKRSADGHIYNKKNKSNKNNNYNNGVTTTLNDSLDIEALEQASYERYRKEAAQRAENG